MCVNGKVPRTKKFTCMTNNSICKARKKIEKKINKAYYGKNENVTHVNIFVGGTFPLTHIVFYPP